MKQSRDSVQVFLDGECLRQVIGTFYPNEKGYHEVHAFAYAPDWLESDEFFDLDPQLQRCEGEQFAHPSLPLFGALRDAIPDRWGRMLLDRAKTVHADVEKRPTLTLDDVAYLLAVEDATRVGALRFYREEGSFLKESTFPIPTTKDLRSLADACLSIDTPGCERHPEYSSRLARLVSASASLGGARPKASYLDVPTSGKGASKLWIAKFPAINDDYDVGAWEFVLNQLARKAGIVVPDAHLLRSGGLYSTFCIERFDRLETHRVMYASAMTCLERQDGDDNVGYLDVAEFIATHVAKDEVQSQLEQLFRRVVFNVLVGNRDDHLRNHGFLHGIQGWMLSPAFDVNPSPTRRTHAIRLDNTSTEPDVDTVMATAEVYQLTRERAAAILDEVASAVSPWRHEAIRFGISRRAIQMMEDAFA